ncbi:hypothetical protein DID76_02985 [Candidatus Marinamargulisbacteria bacterium SCGC AG-414-C22]|nr:hypothetical protein DID76_02985 [Candidatus Marinamargulisbacteria bacterium SCGC AG-414-C22]
MITAELDNIYYKMSDLGLFCDDKTGGFYQDNFSGKVVQSSRSSADHEISHHDGTRISFFDGDIFLKSLAETEKSFNIKLFEAL